MTRLAGSGGHYTIALLDHEGNKTGHEWPFPSVTTIIDHVVAKPKLMHWYYSTALKGMEALAQKYGDKLPTDYNSLKSLMRTEKHSPYAKRDAKGATGTSVHADLELLAAGKKVKATALNQGLINWWDNKGLSKEDILACEVPLVSFQHRYAGTVDLIYKDPATGQVVLCDLKTGNYIHWTMFVQGEAYREAYQEAGGWVDIVSVLHVPQTLNAGTYTEKVGKDVTFAEFKAILDIYNALPKDWMPDEMA